MTLDFAAARLNMIDSQVRTNDVPDLAVQDAMAHAPRERFCPEGKAYLAYADAEVEYAPGRWMLSPRDAAKLLQGVHGKPGETVLAIAAPYVAALLERMGLTVTRHDGADLRAVTGQYDLVVCEGVVSEVPASWLAAIAPAGRLAVVERRGAIGRAMLYLRGGHDLGSRPLFDCGAPMMAGFEAEKGFVF